MKNSALSLLPIRTYLSLKRLHFRTTNRGAYENYRKMRHGLTNGPYSFKPFDDTRSIFIHVPKCAGVSVVRSIYGNLAGGHATLDDYINAFEPNKLLQYFKFTIVRNPWDRLVSAYFFLKSGGFGPKDRTWFSSELGAYSDFRTFVLNWLTEENIWKWYHFMPQYHFILERRNRLSLDFIGHFENLENDYELIRQKIGVGNPLAVSNSSTHGDYKHYYDQETRSIVRRVYCKDIELLGYTFDNSNMEK